MCRPLDNNETLGSQQASSTNTTTTAAPPKHPQHLEPTTPMKRVRFAANDQIHDIETSTTHDERALRWYSRRDMQQVRTEISMVVEGHNRGFLQAGYDWDGSVLPDDDQVAEFYCLRGLEFLRHEPGQPSRQDIRKDYAQQVLLYRAVIRKGLDEIQAVQALGSYCETLSHDAQLRAQNLARYDELEAWNVYHECRLLYWNEADGQEYRMFPTNYDKNNNNKTNHQPCPSTLRCPDKTTELLDSPTSSSSALMEPYIPSLQEVFSYNSLCRVITSVRTTGLLTPLVYGTTTERGSDTAGVTFW